jgi:ribosomal protein L29
MAIIKKNELKELSLKDIEIKINELQIELMKQRNEKGGKSLKIKEIKKTIAKLLTLRNKLNKHKENNK